MRLFYLSLLAFVLFGCNSDDDSAASCIEFKPAAIETVAEKLNADAAAYLFDVAFRVTNGCGQFDSFAQSTIGTTTTIQVIAKYKGCICTEDTPLREAVYIFNQTTPGTYTLQFKMSKQNFITRTVIVN